MSRLGDLGARLYRGEAGYDFVAKRRLWYGVSILITILAFAGLGIRGLHMGVEFEGGAVFTTEATDVSVERAREVAEEASGSQALVQSLGNDARCGSRSPAWTPTSPTWSARRSRTSWASPPRS